MTLAFLSVWLFCNTLVYVKHRLGDTDKKSSLFIEEKIPAIKKLTDEERKKDCDLALKLNIVLISFFAVFDLIGFYCVYSVVFTPFSFIGVLICQCCLTWVVIAYDKTIREVVRVNKEIRENVDSWENSLKDLTEKKSRISTSLCKIVAAVLALMYIFV